MKAEKADTDMLGGALCLDFSNHLTRLFETDYRDSAENAEAFLHWCVRAEGLSVQEAKRLQNLVSRTGHNLDPFLRRAARFCRTLRGVFSAVARDLPPDPRELRCLNQEVAAAKKNCLLVHTGSDYCWQWSESETLDRALWPIALSAGDLLTSSETERLRICDADTCAWVFLDISKNGRRRWCEMKTCGNRNKVKKFRAKNRA